MSDENSEGEFSFRASGNVAGEPGSEVVSITLRLTGKVALVFIVMGFAIGGMYSVSSKVDPVTMWPFLIVVLLVVCVVLVGRYGSTCLTKLFMHGKKAFE